MINEKDEIEKKVNKEFKRLKEIYKDLPKDDISLVDGLLVEAARLRISLDNLWFDICINGDVELFTQSDKTEPYERERPAARLYNARNKAYQTIIKQLNDLRPEANNKESDELIEFLSGGKR